MAVSAHRFSARRRARSAKWARWARWTRWATFNAVGLAGVFVQLGCLWVLKHLLDVHYLLATVVAVELTILHNFAWHTGWTWMDRPASGSGLLRRLARFNLTSGVVSIVGNTVLMVALVEKGHLHYLAANLIGIAVCSLANFVISDLFVFASALGIVVVWTTAGTTVQAADLHASAAQAFERYARLTEDRLDQERRGETPFLWMDRLPEAQRRDVDARLQQGDVVLSRLSTTTSDGVPQFPDALCHHWMGTVLVPNVPLARIVTLMRAYERYPEIYRPAVRRARTLSRNEDHFKVYLQLFQKRIVSVVLNTESDVTYMSLTPKRAQVRSASTRIAEVRQPGTPGDDKEDIEDKEDEKPVGHDNGFLWRFNNYCALEERDAGTYVQCETVSLSRDLPFGLGWLIGPFVTAVPRESLEFTLRSLRAWLSERR